MANALIILRATGPLPVQAQFKAPADGPVVLFVSGSAWTTTTGGCPLGVQVAIDGASVGVVGTFTNEANSHHTLVPAMFPMPLSYGSHVVSLSATGSTIADANDFFEVVLLY